MCCCRSELFQRHTDLVKKLAEHPSTGVGKFFGPRAVSKKFLGTSGLIFEKLRAEDYILHKTPVDKVEKSSPRAVQKTLEGRIWPAGRTLPTPALVHRFLTEGSVERVYGVREDHKSKVPI
jgi:hypothetical protein